MNIASTEKRYGILLTAFGPGTQHGQKALQDFEQKVRRAVPDIPVRWAFSSELIRTRLAEARSKSDSTKKALQKMLFEKFTHIAVQPLQLISGTEHHELIATVQALHKQGICIEIGKPLLASTEVVSHVARALLAVLPAARQPQDIVLYMGHGSRHKAESAYQELYTSLQHYDSNVHVGSLEGKHTFEVVLSRLLKLKKKHARAEEVEEEKQRIWLLPLFSVIGKHALQDMAGDKASSWRSRLETHGFVCQAVLQGLVEHQNIASIWLHHLQQCLKNLQEKQMSAAQGS